MRCEVNPTADMPERAEQIARIREMERSLEDSGAALERFRTALPQIRSLIAYYESDQWRQDYDDDAAGRFPPDLKRGVLSQDTVFDLLTDCRELYEELGELFETE